jgi:hypothetical protein
MAHATGSLKRQHEQPQAQRTTAQHTGSFCCSPCIAVPLCVLLLTDEQLLEGCRQLLFPMRYVQITQHNNQLRMDNGNRQG